ncbi:hypothetical protein Ahy_B06g081596 isoform C [Arachis hypogaea]|uniref:LRR receptor-like serine/threonine-protein kinase n=1 Tax=Arachis hypogaea TaxID=3818 RepID=A0A444YLE8_ARAHY|nr:hypothetical protein Ahy_B06g081596 isoform C [Arachis hypogaea]
MMNPNLLSPFIFRSYRSSRRCFSSPHATKLVLPTFLTASLIGNSSRNGEREIQQRSFLSETALICLRIISRRISDLKGPDSYFPPLSNLTNLQTLVLRSCNLIGSIPEYFGNVTTLNSL